jgi:hypothetical protein
MPQLLQPIALILLAQLPMHASAMQDLTGGLACICSHDLHTSCARQSLRSCSVGFAQAELLFTQALTYLVHLFPLPVQVFFFLVTAQNYKVPKLQVRNPNPI